MKSPLNPMKSPLNPMKSPLNHNFFPIVSPFFHHYRAESLSRGAAFHADRLTGVNEARQPDVWRWGL
jgi:hypothetical protein